MVNNHHDFIMNHHGSPTADPSWITATLRAVDGPGQQGFCGQDPGRAGADDGSLIVTVIGCWLMIWLEIIFWIWLNCGSLMVEIGRGFIK